MMRVPIKEEHAIVLDFLPNGYPFDTRPNFKKTPIAQAIGKEHFTLLELVPKRDQFLQPYEEVYMGEGKRDKIHHIAGKIPFSKLTQTAKMELEIVIKDIVEKNQQRFIKFFNIAGPINMRSHQLELLPGIGKKHMKELVEKRKEKEFEDFEDIRTRVKLMPNPEQTIIKRIFVELEELDRYKLFVGI